MCWSLVKNSTLSQCVLPLSKPSEIHSKDKLSCSFLRLTFILNLQWLKGKAAQFYCFLLLKYISHAVRALFDHSDVTVDFKLWQRRKHQIWHIDYSVCHGDIWNVCFYSKEMFLAIFDRSSGTTGNLWSQLRLQLTFMLHAAEVPHRALCITGLCSSSCQTANWISWCETDMIVSSATQFQNLTMSSFFQQTRLHTLF